MFAFLFACCGLRRPHDPPDERTPLIPTPSQVPPLVPVALLTPYSPQPPVVDHHRLKERLGSVVRSKEGKMVNVNAHFPFHLHSRPHDNSSSRSSRNVSGGTLDSSRAASPSPARLQKSASTASLRPDGEDAPHYLPLVVSPSTLILNVRLVKSARSVQSTRGRSQRSGDNGRAQQELAPHELSAPPPSDTHQPEAPPYPEDFKIHDAGAVARSWGD